MAVVLGYDESPGAERALSAAIEVASAFGDQLIIVFGAAPPGSLGEEYQAARSAVEELGRVAVEHAVAAAQEAGVPTAVELLDEKPAQAIMTAADKHDARVIVVGTWGESPIRGAMLGSTSHKLLHLSDRPVLCVPAKVD